jgi:MGT family glycosyltransferase
LGRFLFVVPPLVGHTNPTVPLGRELAERGHAVAWTGHREVADLVPASAPFLAVAEAKPPEVVEAIDAHLSQGRGGPGGFMSLWRQFIVPIARQMVPGVHAAVDDFAPDVLVVDQSALAGAAVAELRGLPWATTATTSAELVNPLAYLAKVDAWLRNVMHDVLVDVGLDDARATSLDPRFSPHLVLAFTTAELVGPAEGFPDHYALVGPSIGDRPVDTPFPWDWLDGPGPVVFLSLGTENWRGGARFFRVASEALAAMDARAVFVAPGDVVHDRPANVLVVPRVPQLALLPHVDAVVSHGGHNTVCEALAEGRPLVIAPIRDDQPIVADQVARAGAGIRVKFGRITAAALRQAIESVLTEPGYRAAAERLGASFRAAGGPPAAADRLESLLPAHQLP